MQPFMYRAPACMTRTRSANSSQGQPPPRSAPTTAGEQAVHWLKAAPVSAICRSGSIAGNDQPIDTELPSQLRLASSLTRISLRSVAQGLQDGRPCARPQRTCPKPESWPRSMCAGGPNADLSAASACTPDVYGISRQLQADADTWSFVGWAKSQLPAECGA